MHQKTVLVASCRKMLRTAPFLFRNLNLQCFQWKKKRQSFVAAWAKLPEWSVWPTMSTHDAFITKQLLTKFQGSLDAASQTGEQILLTKDYSLSLLTISDGPDPWYLRFTTCKLAHVCREAWQILWLRASSCVSRALNVGTNPVIVALVKVVLNLMYYFEANVWNHAYTPRYDWYVYPQAFPRNLIAFVHADDLKIKLPQGDAEKMGEAMDCASRGERFDWVCSHSCLTLCAVEHVRALALWWKA